MQLLLKLTMIYFGLTKKMNKIFSCSCYVWLIDKNDSAFDRDNICLQSVDLCNLLLKNKVKTSWFIADCGEFFHACLDCIHYIKIQTVLSCYLAVLCSFLNYLLICSFLCGTYFGSFGEYLALCLM